MEPHCNLTSRTKKRPKTEKKRDVGVEPPFAAQIALPRQAMSVARCLNASLIVFQLFQVKGFSQKREPLFTP